MSNKSTKFHPILFSTPMVQAILNGTKTQTRRIIKKKYSNTDIVWHEKHSCRTKILVELQNDAPKPRKNEDGSITHTLIAYHEIECRYKVGDVLWVRETFCKIPDLSFSYKASICENSEDIRQDYLKQGQKWANWKPSIFMPKKACRIFLKVKSIRIERLQDISEKDAIAEGVESKNNQWRDYFNNNTKPSFGMRTAARSFKTLWYKINGLNSWKENPYVFVYEFEKIEKPLDFIV